MSVSCPAYQHFEQILAWHCAPSLAGIKAADLVCWEPPAEGAAHLLYHYAETLSQRGIRLRVLRRSGSRLLLLVFRPIQLERYLAQPPVKELLAQAGYPVHETMDLDALLTHLCQRLAQPEFPHEIGLFLGYPAEDVEGFRRHGGRNCKLCGCWKVYGDVEHAQRMFDRFLRCRRALTRRVEQGLRLEQIFVPMPAAA